MNERLKQLRKALEMTMDEFGRLIGISKSGVSEIEQGRRNVTEQHLIMLSNTTPKGKIINIDWIRTGKGEMFYDGTEYDFVAHFTASLMKEKPDSFKNRFVKALSEISEDDWKTIEDFAKKLSVTKQCVSNWENDNVLPSIEMLVRIADFFGVSTDYLLGRCQDNFINTNGLTEEQITQALQIAQLGQFIEENAVYAQNLDI